MVVSIVIVVALIGLAFWAFRMEPHWSSKDGKRFICRLQPLSDDLGSEGMHREMRCTVVNGGLQITPRGLRGVRNGGLYKVMAKSPEPPRGRAVYLLSSEGRQVALRVPASSRCVPVLDELAAQSGFRIAGGEPPSPGRPGTQPEDPSADPG